jgi:hypothetical protein
MSADLATQVSPALGSLHYTTTPSAYWTVSECDWLVDSLYTDFQIDKGAGILSNLYAGNLRTAYWYSNAVDEWNFMFGIATQACWRGGAITGDQAATAVRDAMGDGWNGHPAHFATDAAGSFDQFWDRNWTDTYQEIAILFLEVPGAPAAYCMQGGAGTAASSHCTQASVLASLGVTPG